MKYIDFELQIKQDSQGSYTISYPMGGGNDREDLALLFEDDDVRRVIKNIEEVGRRSSPPNTLATMLPEFGRQMFDTLFKGRIRDRFIAEYRAALEKEGRLRIKLNIMPPDLMGLPWEFLYSDHTGVGDFLALSHNTVVTRYAQGQPPRKPPDEGLVPPLRILGMVSLPRDTSDLNASEEKQHIQNALRKLIERGQVWIDWLEEATFEALNRKLQTRDRDYHIFHYIGHGTFENEGNLLFENENGNAQRIKGEDLGYILASQPYLRLAVLNACESAQTSASNPFASVATALVKQGIPAVIAMQYAIRDSAAIEFSQQIYEGLGEGLPIERVVTNGRVMLKMKSTGEWGIPVLYLGIPGDELFPLSFKATQLEKQIRELIDKFFWEEAAHLCTLMREKAPHLYLKDRATCLQALALAYIADKKQDWDSVLHHCDAGERRVEAGDQDSKGRFEILRRKAEEEQEIAALLEQARRELKAGHPIQVTDICGRILQKRGNEPQAKALLQGIKTEEQLNGHRLQLTKYLSSRNWSAMLQTAEMALRSTGTVDLQAAGIEFPNYIFISEVFELARYYQKAQELLEKENWEQAETFLQRINERRSDLCPEAQLLYAQSRKLLASGKKSEAIIKLQRLRDIEPSYLDSEQLLKSLTDEDKERGRLRAELEEHLRNRKWIEALDLCKRITAFTSFETGDSSPDLVTALESLLAFLSRVRSRLVSDPNLRWPGGLPYDIFARLGISPQSSIDAVNNASYDLQLQDSGMSTEEQAAWDRLRTVPQRLFLDAFLYPINHPEEVVEFFESSFSQHRALPSVEQLKAGIPDDAAIVLLLLGQREQAAQLWAEKQRDNPSDGWIAHQQSLLYYWWSWQDGTQEHWSKAIANWALVLEDDVFWQNWGEERQSCYGVSVGNHLAMLRKKLEGKLVEDLASYPHLGIAFHAEVAAAHILKKAGGLPIPGSLFDKIACGLLMIRALSLETQLARFTFEHYTAAQDIGKQMEHLDSSTDLLQRYFSQIRIAAVLLDRDLPEQALAALDQTDYSLCPTDTSCPARARQTANTLLPRVYCVTCPHFEQANPAYRLLPDAGQALLDDALEIAIAAHLRLAEQILTSPTPVLRAVAEHWRQAVELAKITSKGPSRLQEVQLSVGEIGLGRAQFLLHKVSEEEDESSFTWYEQIDELLRVSTEIAGRSADFTTVQAEALAQRGIQRLNQEDPVGAESDLRQAFGLQPSSLRIREQLVVAKQELAIFAKVRGGLPRAMQILEEARQLCEDGLKMFPENSKLKEHLEYIEFLLSSWEGVTVQVECLKEVELLAQQLEQSPSDEETRFQLLDALIQCSEDLNVEGHQEQAIGELERRLPLFPHDTRLRNQIGFIREGYKVKGYLRAGDLNFADRVEVASRANRSFSLPFVSPGFPDIHIYVDVVGDVAVTSTPLGPSVDVGNSQMLRSLLQSFHKVPFYKPCWLADTGTMTLVVESPVALLTYKVLESTVRTAARFVKIPPAAASSPQKLSEHLKEEFMDFTEPLSDSLLPVDLIPSVCQKANISCLGRADGEWVLRRTPDGPEVIALYNDIVVRLFIEVGKLSDASHASYLQLTIVNAAMRTCKVVLDEEEKVLLVADLPHLNEEWLLLALEELENSLSRFSETFI
jgi:CHAT domain